MTHQLRLFDARKFARRDDPETSKVAAAMAEPVRSRHARLILDVLALSLNAMTCEQIAEHARTLRWADVDAVQIARRMAELHAEGLVTPDGTGTTSSGRPARRWRLA